MSHHERFIARTGLLSALLLLTGALAVLAHQSFTATPPVPISPATTPVSTNT